MTLIAHCRELLLLLPTSCSGDGNVASDNLQYVLCLPHLFCLAFMPRLCFKHFMSPGFMKCFPPNFSRNHQSWSVLVMKPRPAPARGTRHTCPDTVETSDGPLMTPQYVMSRVTSHVMNTAWFYICSGVLYRTQLCCRLQVWSLLSTVVSCSAVILQ